MKTTSIQSNFYEAQSNISKSIKLTETVKGSVRGKCINTLIPDFRFKNHKGEVILPNTCLAL